MFRLHYFWHVDVVPESSSLPIPCSVVKPRSPSWSTPSAWWPCCRHRACSDERSPRPSSRCRPGTTSHSPRSTPGDLRSLPGEDSKGRKVITSGSDVRDAARERVARSHLAGVNSSGQESAAEHPGGDLALRHHVAHRVVDDFYRCLLQHLRLLTCKSRTKGSALRHVTPVFVTNIKRC